MDYSLLHSMSSPLKPDLKVSSLQYSDSPGPFPLWGMVHTLQDDDWGTPFMSNYSSSPRTEKERTREKKRNILIKN